MKKVFLCITVFLCVWNMQSQEKFYLLKEVDVAPKFKAYKNIDSLDSKKNFTLYLRRSIAINLDISSYAGKKTKVFVEFVVEKTGVVKVLQIKGKSDQAKAIVIQAFEKIKKLEPAILKNKKVNMKFIIPVTINEVIIIDKTNKHGW
ncbi:MAG: hypothetical protein P8H13_03505 [Polaribacter sp.]|nr:hypothetical protein [Polaribacter sp.]MDG1993968.1 hypothetical protein [Polaribacter sp.]